MHGKKSTAIVDSIRKIRLRGGLCVSITYLRAKPIRRLHKLYAYQPVNTIPKGALLVCGHTAKINRYTYGLTFASDRLVDLPVNKQQAPGTNCTMYWRATVRFLEKTQTSRRDKHAFCEVQNSYRLLLGW